MAEILDGLGVAVCLFDEQDCAVLWNRGFLRLFPEHDGAIQAGEHYRDNLLRFYRARLGPEDMPHIERYVADGIARHRAQSRPFDFAHRGKWLRVASQPVPGGGRIRIWTPIAAPSLQDGTGPTGLGADSDRAIMENVADGILLLDIDGRIASVNEQFLVLYGLASRQEAIGLRYAELVDGLWRTRTPATGTGTEEEARGARWSAKLAEDQRFAGAPFEVPLPTGRWLRVAEQRSQRGLVYSTHVDITDFKRQQHETAEARAAADRANAAKSAFLAMMSHEIRTPMNGIIGMTELLLGSGLDGDQQGYAVAVQTSATALRRILDDVLDLSKLEAGKLGVEAIGFPLAETIEGVAALLAPGARERGLALDCRIAPALRRWFTGDPTRLRQVLLNLLSNALKFTESGSVLITADPDAADRVRIAVADTGIGFSPGALVTLFDRFEQGDGSIARRFGGTGLGLHISKQLVELMGGRIGAEPRPDGGSVFWFALPLAPAAAPPPTAPAPAVERPAPATAAGGLVLVVEDNPINQRITLAMLQQAGFETALAETGAAAVAAVRERPPVLVLMDIRLPDMDGVQVTRRIRDIGPHVARLPIVALTANAMAGDRERYLAAGLDDFLPKPFSRQALLALLRRWTDLD